MNFEKDCHYIQVTYLFINICTFKFQESFIYYYYYYYNIIKKIIVIKIIVIIIVHARQKSIDGQC